MDGNWFKMAKSGLIWVRAEETCWKWVDSCKRGKKWLRIVGIGLKMDKVGLIG